MSEKMENKSKDNLEKEQEELQNIIGLGKFSARKTYYPELQKIIEELKKEKDKFRRIMDNSPDMIYRMSLPDGKYEYVSSAVESIIGYTSNELIEDSMLIKKILHPEFHKYYQEEWEKLLAGNMSSFYEYKIVHKNGSIRWLNQRNLLIKDIDNKPVAVEGIVTDITERIEAEQAIKTNETKFRSIVQASPMGIFIFRLKSDGKLVFSDTNESSSKMLGFDCRRFINKSLEEAFPALAGSVIPEELKKVAIYDSSFESEHIDYEDELIKGAFEFHAFRTEPNTVAVMFLEITPRLTAQERLKESEYKYRQLIKQSNDAIYLFYENKFELINSRFEKMFGYNQLETIKPDFSFMKLVSPKSIKMIKERIEKSKQGEKLDPVYEFIAVTKSGKELICEVSVSYINYKMGTAVQGVIRDITERKKAEEELKKLSRAVQQSPVGVLITDPNGIIEYVNPKFLEMTGYKNDELIGSNPKVLKSGHHSREFYKNLWVTILSGLNWQGELLNRKKNGELYWENQTISPILNEHNEIIRFVSLKEDVTEKKKMVEDLVNAKEKAELSDRMKSDFLAQISHEIRTPLNSVMSYTNLLKDEFYQGDNSEELDEIFGSISNSVSRIIRTIDLILNASELQANSYDLSLRSFDLFYDVILKVYNDLKHAAKLKKIDLIIDKQVEETIVVIDEYSVYQTIVNLVDNAIKYTDKGQVVIRLRKSDFDSLQVEVEDTGIGISKDYMEHLYDAFSQEEVGYTRKFEGTGLGLALVKKYCELNNIHISVISEKTVGTTFKLVFPTT